jgi:hypothetical protein
VASTSTFSFIKKPKPKSVYPARQIAALIPQHANAMGIESYVYICITHSVTANSHAPK